jgi:hypothetical protein
VQAFVDKASAAIFCIVFLAVAVAELRARAVIRPFQIHRVELKSLHLVDPVVELGQHAAPKWLLHADLAAAQHQAVALAQAVAQKSLLAIHAVQHQAADVLLASLSFPCSRA